MKFWRVYFWIYILVLLGVITYYISTGIISNHIARALDNSIGRGLVYLALFIPAIAIFGLGYRRKTLHHIFWKFYFFYFLFGIVKPLKDGIENISIFFPFQIITLIGLFIYAFMQNKLFGKNDYKGSDLNFKLTKEI